MLPSRLLLLFVCFSQVHLIGSHEIELGSLIPDDDFLSGRIFVGTTYSINTTSKAGDDKTPPSTPSSSKSRAGSNLFAKQRLANKPPPKPIDIEAMANDPAILLLNKEGVIQRNEKVKTQFAAFIPLCSLLFLLSHSFIVSLHFGFFLCFRPWWSTCFSRSSFVRISAKECSSCTTASWA